MDISRLRRTVSVAAIAATAAAAAAIAAHPFPNAGPVAADATASLADREARAAERLREAERRLLAVAAGDLPPAVSVASPGVTPVTQSESS